MPGEFAVTSIAEAFDAALEGLGKVAWQAIVLELSESLTALGAREDQAKARRADAVQGLETPHQAAAALNAEIAEAQADRARWEAQTTEDTPREQRGAARMQVAECDADIARLSARRDHVLSQAQPLVDARNAADRDLEHIKAAKLSVAVGMADPFRTAVGQGTRAYIALRQPFLNLVLLTGNRDHPEYELGIAQLEEMCKATGFRTDHLPSVGEIEAARITAAMANPADAVADPVPNAAEVLALDKANALNSALQQQKTHMPEDHRTAPPHPARSWMRLPGR